MLAGEDQTLSERPAQRLADTEDLVLPRRRVTRADMRFVRPVHQACRDQRLAITRVEAFQRRLVRSRRRQAASGENGEHQVLAGQAHLLVGAFPYLAQPSRAAERRAAAVDPHPAIELAEELDRRAGVHHAHLSGPWGGPA